MGVQVKGPRYPQEDLTRFEGSPTFRVAETIAKNANPGATRRSGSLCAGAPVRCGPCVLSACYSRRGCLGSVIVTPVMWFVIMPKRQFSDRPTIGVARSSEPPASRWITPAFRLAVGFGGVTVSCAGGYWGLGGLCRGIKAP